MKTMTKRTTAIALVVAGTAAAMVVGPATPAAAAGEWCNNSVCLKTTNSGLYHDVVEVSVWTGNQSGRIVTGRIFNGRSVWHTKKEQVGSFTTYRGYAKVDRVLRNQSKLCADGYIDGRPVGRPCVTIVA